MRFLSALAFLILLTSTACNSPSRTDNLGKVNHDDDQMPGNEGGLEYEDGEGADATAVGAIDSYGNLPDAEERSLEYSNVFRRDASDADYAIVTDADLDMPHVAPDERVPTGALGGQVATYDVDDRGRESVKYGSARSSQLPGEVDLDDDLRGANARAGNQAAIGAEGSANAYLDDYFDSDEEDYRGDGRTGNSWYRPLDPNERDYAKSNIVRIGGATETEDYQARYNELKSVLYSVENNQQAVAYAPNNYTYSYLTTWGNLYDTDSYGSRAVATPNRAPVLGTGCDQDEDPIGCSTANLDRELRGFLNDPRVLRDLQASQISGVSFDVDAQGNIAPNSVRAEVDGQLCYTAACRRVSRTLEGLLTAQTWTPAQRSGRAAISRVVLPLRYRMPAAESES